MLNELQGEQNIHGEIGATIVTGVQAGKRSLVDFAKYMFIKNGCPSPLQTGLYFWIHP
jgi:hypothetical protein